MKTAKAGSKWILLVDDEPKVLASLSRLLRPLETAVRVAEGGSAALELIRMYGPPAVIVSDQCMPEMTGVSFLERTLDSCPDTVRILLTAKPDLSVALAALDGGIVERFMTKPWEPEKFRATIKRCLTVGRRGAGKHPGVRSKEEQDE